MDHQPKGLLRDRHGQALIERAVAIGRQLAQRAVIIGDPAGPYADLEAPVVPDVLPKKGAPGGVHAALSHAPEPGWVLVLACDLPEIHDPMLESLWASRTDEAMAVLYTAGGRVQPLAGWWHTQALPQIDRLLRTGNPGFRQILEAVPHTLVAAESARPFLNVNRPEEAAAAGLKFAGRQ